jgi:AbiV family abortive infection protein
MGKPLSQYCGVLSPSQVAAGMNAAVANARRLAEDARLLLDAERFPTAASLAILALEEVDKATILRELLSFVSSKKELAEYWRRYRRHTEKNFFALLPDLVREGARELHEFKSIFTKETEEDRARYDTVKQLGFYTDCCGDAHWSIPIEVIDKNLASFLTSLALDLTKVRDLVTAKELQLWALHMSGGMTRENLLRWCSAMVEAGLKPHEYIEEMRRFTQELENSKA